MQYIIQFLKYTLNLQMLQNEQNFYEQKHECYNGCPEILDTIKKIYLFLTQTHIAFENKLCS